LSTREFATPITQRGQITGPAEVRRLHGLKPRDKVAFAVEDGRVRLKRVAVTVESAYGSVPALPGDDLDEQIRQVKDERAERTVCELSGR
jgi:AbrB family looped-hinge helix DNA binding protein